MFEVQFLDQAWAEWDDFVKAPEYEELVKTAQNKLAQAANSIEKGIGKGGKCKGPAA